MVGSNPTRRPDAPSDPPTMADPKPISANPAFVVLGVAGCLGYGVHATHHFLAGTPQDALWTCHLSAVLVGVALLIRSPLMNGVGLLCLSIGLPTWILYLVAGEPFIPTSPLTHVLGLVLGIVGARSMGLPRHSWWVAVLFVAALILLSRFVTPAEANVNLAFGPIEGMSLWKVEGVAHWALLLTQWAFGLAIVQFVWSRIFERLERKGVRVEG